MNKWKIARVILALACILAVVSGLRHLYDSWRIAHARSLSAQQTATVTVRSGSPQCPGVPPNAPTPISTQTVLINPNGCDLAYAVVKGAVVLSGPGGSIRVSSTSNVVGRRDYSIYRTVRAEGADAAIFYMLCPLGKGPVDGGWSCRS